MVFLHLLIQLCKFVRQHLQKTLEDSYDIEICWERGQGCFPTFSHHEPPSLLRRKFIINVLIELVRFVLEA